jgi:DNA-binding transcriptional ArsR family regulator
MVSVMANDAFRALAHPIRRGIVERLAHGPATVGEATGVFGVSKPTISRHVKVLEDSGVVVRTIDGRTHRLSLDLDAIGEAVSWIDRQRAVWERMFDVVEEYAEEQLEDR